MKCVLLLIPSCVSNTERSLVFRKIIFMAKGQSEMQKIKCIPLPSGLFGPFNVSVILFVLFYVCTFNSSLGLCYTHVFQMLSNNQTYLECKLDVFCISMQNQTPICNFQQCNLSETVKTVEPYEQFVGSLRSVATPFALILND